MEAVDPHTFAAASASRFLSIYRSNSLARIRKENVSRLKGTHLEVCQSSPGMQVHFPSTLRSRTRFNPRGEQTTVKALEVSSEFFDVLIHLGNMGLVSRLQEAMQLLAQVLRHG
jgi:hypothetical protein